MLIAFQVRLGSPLWFHESLLEIPVHPNGITDREQIFCECFLHIIADTDTDENYFGISFS